MESSLKANGFQYSNLEAMFIYKVTLSISLWLQIMKLIEHFSLLLCTRFTI